MSAHGLAFVIFLPCIWIILTAIGWSKDNLIEEDITKVWIPQSGSFLDDKEYKDSIVQNDPNDNTACLAMSKSRDNQHIFTVKCLEEILQGREASGKTTVDH